MENFLEYRMNLKQDPFLIKDISPDDEDYELFCKDAVIENGLALEFVNYINMSSEEYENICESALRNTPEAMKFVDPNKVENYQSFCFCVLEGRRRTSISTYTKGIC